MNTITVQCGCCKRKSRAVAMIDGTYLMVCKNQKCKMHMVMRSVIVTECPACTAPVTAYEQDRAAFSALPRIFQATCWNQGCNRHGFTFSTTLEEESKQS